MRRNTLLLCGLTGLALAVGACEGDDDPRGDAAQDSGGQVEVDGGTCMSFVTPARGSVVKPTAASDCTAGVVRDVVVAIQAADGTPVSLSVPGAADAGADGGAQDLTATASGAQAIFKNVLLPIGQYSLNALAGDCAASAPITVECSPPTCAISAPIINATHPMLNGVAVAQGGDRVSSPGSDYQASFQVTTNAEDGQSVQLIVDDAATTLTARVTGGKATFTGVTLSPDKIYAVDAVCTAASGLKTTDSKSFSVDTVAPDLAVTQPVDGQHFDPEALVSGKFTVCAKTTAADALNPGVAVLNFCAAIGTATPTCVEATGAETGSGICPSGSTALALDCPGSAPFTVNVTLKDLAGNPTTKAITGVTCASSRPSVQIVSPAGDSTPFNTVAKHLLAANSGQTFKDQDATKAGAQWTVVACSNTAGKATLYAGQAAGTLSAVGATVDTVAAVAADNCPANYGNVARFTSATLPESLEDAAGGMASATELRVDVVDATSTKGQSPVVDLWVDSLPPSITPFSPTPLCGRIQRQTTDWSAQVRLGASVAGVQLVVTTNGTPVTYTPTSYSYAIASFNSVVFAAGTSAIAATASEPSGNTGALQSPCTVTVGQLPLVQWVSPVSGSRLCAATTSTGCVADSDGTVAGWQGTLRVQVFASGSPATSGTVTFASAGTTLGVGSIDASGFAQIALTTTGLSDDEGATVTATTSDIGGNGSSSQSATFIVDTITPGALSGLAASVKDRRQTSFALDWTAPGDGGKAAAGYDVRVSTSAITEANFDSAERITYAGKPAEEGSPQSIDVGNRLIEKAYYFAVAAIDLAGNRGPIATTGSAAAHFNLTILSPPSGGPAREYFGYGIDGSTDLNGDGFSDLLVGTYGSTKAYIFNGATSFVAGAPTTIIQSSTPYFASSVAVAGDLDDDGLAEIAVGSPFSGYGAVFIYKGRSVWPAILTEADADYVISGDESYAGSFFGFPVTRIGDFDGDGVSDLAISAGSFRSGDGRVVIVRGAKRNPDGSSAFTSVSLPSTSRSIVVDGPSGGAGNFGAGVMSFGPVAQNAAKLLIGAPKLNSDLGRVYAFRGESAAAGSIAPSSSPWVLDGSIAGQQLGNRIALIGPMFGSTFGIGLTGNQFTGAPALDGSLDVRFSNPANGPFSCGAGEICRVLIDSATTSRYDGFGYFAAGGTFSGTSTTTSLLGDSTPDIVACAGSEKGAASKVYLVDGRRLALLPSPSDVTSSSDVILSLPTGWMYTNSFSTIIKDLNGDSFGDIALGEYSLTGPGRVAVFW